MHLQAAAGAAPPAAWADRGVGGRGGGSGVLAGATGRSTVRDDDEGGAGARRSSIQPEVRGVLEGCWKILAHRWMNGCMDMLG